MMHDPCEGRHACFFPDSPETPILPGVRALHFDGSVVHVSDVPEPRACDESVLVRVSVAGICNTDLEIVRGYMGFRGILGHEFVGTVEEGPEEWRGQRVVGEINRFRMRHTTLVPGRELTGDATPLQPGQPSLLLEGENLEADVEQCVSGPIYTHENATLRVSNSILDANAYDESDSHYLHRDVVRDAEQAAG